MKRTMSAAVAVWVVTLMAGMGVADEIDELFAPSKTATAALKLARDGWMLDRFCLPNPSDAGRLGTEGLPARYDAFDALTKLALRKYYARLAAGREATALESAVEAYVKAPSDAAARGKAVSLMLERIHGIDLDSGTLDENAIIPRRIWDTPPGYGQTLDIALPLYVRRERAAALGEMFGSAKLLRYHRWEELVSGYTRLIEGLYPSASFLRGRAEAQLLLGEYALAHEDALLAMAVEAWERANSFEMPERPIGQLGLKAELTKLHGYGTLAKHMTTQPDAHPLAATAQVLDDLRNSHWSALVEFMKRSPSPGTIEYDLHQRLQTDAYGTTRTLILSTAFWQYKGETAERQAESWKAFSWSAPLSSEWAMVGYRKESDPDKRQRYLLAAADDGTRNPDAFYELGQFLEEHNDKAQAMLAYNVAAGGEAANKLTDTPRIAARARNRLEGEASSYHALKGVYEAQWRGLNVKVDDASISRLEAAYLEGIASRLLNRDHRSELVGARALARRAMDDHQGAISDFRELMRLEPSMTAQACGFIGKELDEIGAYDKAIAQYNQAIQTGDAPSWVYVARAMNHAHQGEYDRMLTDLSMAIQRNPQDGAAYEQRSKYYEYVSAETDKALGDAEKALALLKKMTPRKSTLHLRRRIINLQHKDMLRDRLSN